MASSLGPSGSPARCSPRPRWRAGALLASAPRLVDLALGLVATPAIYHCPHCDVQPFRTAQALGGHLNHKHKALKKVLRASHDFDALQPGALVAAFLLNRPAAAE
eukprot:278571-Heterocapsa_arctica.AAC.1